jgi:hypothetical protein
MRSYLGWNVQEARLWEVRPDHFLIGDWATDAIRLADYSHSADVETELIDVGNGASEADYKGKDVRGKIVLADGVLASVQQIAVIEHGAAGIVSDMPNQTTAWAGLDKTLVRWGHLDARQPTGFAFMVSRATAEALRAQLQTGRPVLLNAHVKAMVEPGHWTVVTAVIPGADPASPNSSPKEIIYSCHLDHERPGANDNGSGCVTILESARVLAHLIRSGALPPPRRTLRFIWGPEVEGTMAFLASHPEIRQRAVANVHMDMVGGDFFKNKSIFHVTATPWSLPSFVTDVGAVFLEAIRTAASGYAAGDLPAEAGIIERTEAGGTRNELIADVTPYSSGSDHDDYDSSTIAIPSLYLRDWPDIYIHTDLDTVEQIDPTKLRRVALLGAAAGYVYANLEASQIPTLIPFLIAQSQSRLAQGYSAAQQLLNDSQLAPPAAWYEAHNLLQQTLRRETGTLHSLVAFTGAPEDPDTDGVQALTSQAAIYEGWLRSRAQAAAAKTSDPIAPWAGLPGANRIPVRIGAFGPLTYQNDNVLLARLGKERYVKIQLLNSDATPMLNVRNQGELYAYEIVNFIDGKRTVGEIRDAVSAEYGPLPVNLVFDYLQACAEAGVIQWK